MAGAGNSNRPGYTTINQQMVAKAAETAFLAVTAVTAAIAATTAAHQAAAATVACEIYILLTNRHKKVAEMDVLAAAAATVAKAAAKVVMHLQSAHKYCNETFHMMHDPETRWNVE